MSDTPAVYVLTNSQLRTLLESVRAGDSIDDAMLTAQDLTEANEDPDGQR